MSKGVALLLSAIFALPLGLIRSFLAAAGASEALGWLVGILLGLPTSLLILVLIAEHTNQHDQ